MRLSRHTSAEGSCEVRSGPIAIHPAILRIAASANQRIGRIRTKPDAAAAKKRSTQRLESAAQSLCASSYDRRAWNIGSRHCRPAAPLDD